MAEHNFTLLPEEQVMFERPQVVLTNRRLLAANKRLKSNSNVEVPLSNVSAPDKFNSGQKNRRAVGAKMFGAGVAVVFLESVVSSTRGMNQNIEALLFVVGALSAVIGLYLLLASFLQISPRTTVVFPVVDGEEIVITFPEWDSEEAEELARQFRRAKRGL